ncbi:MAG: preprotein translocase subunit SecG, partial [Alphaproteobacteria bacterium]
MQNMFLVLHLLICVVLVGAVLMQRSEGGALGMGGGGGGLISGRGAADMMVNITSWVGGAFFVTSIVLTVMAGARPVDRSVITDGQRPQSGIHFNLPFFNQGAAKKEA